MRMRKLDQNNQKLKEFARFADAPELTPRRQTDDAVRRRAETNQNPSTGGVIAKFLALQVSSGMVTLAICPQFGIGLGNHSGVLHALHANLHPALYYLSCGVLFVLMGALFSGLASNRRELKALGGAKYLFFGSYSLWAYLALLILGTESFPLISAFWIMGGVAGHLIGFDLGRRLKTANA